MADFGDHIYKMLGLIIPCIRSLEAHCQRLLFTYIFLDECNLFCSYLTYSEKIIENAQIFS